MDGNLAGILTSIQGKFWQDSAKGFLKQQIKGGGENQKEGNDKK